MKFYVGVLKRGGSAETAVAEHISAADDCPSRRAIARMAAFLFLALLPGVLLAEPLHVSVAAPNVLVPHRYILESDPARDVLRVTVQTTVSRNAFCPVGNLLLPCPATNVFVRYTVRLMREAIEVATAQVVTNYSLGGTSMLNVEQILELSPVALLKDGAQHYIAYEIEHIEDPANGKYVEDQAGDTMTMVIAHFTGPLRFGSVGSTLQKLAANPTYLGALGWSLNIAQGVTTNGFAFSHTGVVPPPVVAVCDDAGALAVSSGSVQVTGAGTFEWMGWSGKRGLTRLSTTGFSTETLSLDMPPGIGWRFAGERKLRAQFQLPVSPVALDTNLNPSVSLSGKVTNALQFFAETYPVEFASTGWRWSSGQLSLVGPQTRFVRQVHYQDWETAKGDIPDSNDGFWTLLRPDTTSSLSISPGFTGGISIALRFDPGLFFSHFPLTATTNALGGVMRIENSHVVPAESQLNDALVHILYGKGCRSPGDPTGLPEPQQAVRMTVGALQFTPQAGLWAEGPVMTPAQNPTVENHLEIGLANGTPTHETDAFATLRYYMPGTWVPHTDGFDRSDDGNASVDEPGEDPQEFNPSRYLLSGLRSDLGFGLEHPGTSPYAAGAGDYPGGNMIHYTGLEAHSHIGGGDTGDYPLTDRSKFYIRLSGVSGILESAAGPNSLPAYGYAVSLTNFGLSFLSNEPQESRINGSINLPYPSGFTQNFEELMLTCCGNIADGKIAPGDDDKNLAYWSNADFTSETLRFTHDPNDPCDTSDALLELGVTGYIGHLPGGHAGFLYPRANGVLNAQDALDRESHLALPAQVEFASYGLVPVRHAYFNYYPEFPAAGNPVPGPGWINVVGLQGVPFFRDLEVHAQVLGSTGAFEPPLFVVGGWKSAGDSFFNQAYFDSGHRGFPPLVSPANYRTNQNYLTHAQQVWFGLVPFDYPVAFNQLTRTFHSPTPSGLDLAVLDVNCQVERLNSELASLRFQGVFDVEALLNPVNLLESQIEDLVTGFVQDIGAAAIPIKSGMNALSDLLDVQSRRLVDEVILPALEPDVIDPLVDSLEAGLSALEIDERLDLYLDLPLQEQLEALGQHAAGGSAIVQQVNQRLGQVRSALEAVNNILLTLDTIENLLLSALQKNGVPINEIPQDVLDEAKESLLGAGGGGQLAGRLIELKAAVEDLRGVLTEVISRLEQGQEFAARVDAIFTDVANFASVAGGAKPVLSFWLKTEVYPDILEWSPEELRERIRSELRDRILQSQAMTELHTALRELSYGLDAAVRDALATVTQAINDEIMGLLAGVFDELEEQLAPLKNFGQYLKSAGISGHSVIRGDRLALLRLDGVAEITIQEIPITFNGFFEYRELTSDGPASCDLPVGERLNEVTLGASGAATAMFGGDNRISIATKFSFEDQLPALPIGLFGSFERTEGGGFEVETFRIDELSASLAIGGGTGKEYYLSAYVHTTFSDYVLAGGIFLGKTCGPEPLAWDPFAATVLSENPNFTGVYVFGAGTFPIYSFNCLLSVNVGAEVSAFAGTHLGGRIGGSVSGEALCLVSAKGEASLAYAQSGDEKLYQGHLGLSAKIGLCPLCAKWDKNFNATYQKTSGWDF